MIIHNVSELGKMGKKLKISSLLIITLQLSPQDGIHTEAILFV